jgi:recombination protein RecT
METENQQTTEQQPTQAQTTVIEKKETYTPERTAEAIKKLPTILQPIKGLFAQPWESFRSAFKDPAEADRIMQREVTYAAQAMTSNGYLITCAQKSPQHFVEALKNVALSGLSLSPVLKQGYLVPFNGLVSFIPSYMGLIDILVNAGIVAKIEAHCVYKGENYEICHGTEEYLRHNPNWENRTKENLVGCYWIATLLDGTKVFGDLSIDEIEVIRKRAPSAKNKSPWDSDYTEMARKTAVRRGFKMLPKKGISEDKLKSVEAVFDYDEKVVQSWIKNQKQGTTKNDSFDEDETADYEVVE